MNRFILILALWVYIFPVLSQTELQVGDIAFLSINSDGSDDQFAFVFLKDVLSGTEINFTDNGWTAEGSFNGFYSESHFLWVADSDLSAGTVECISTYNGNLLPSSKYGTITGDKMTISVAGDQVLAYQGDKVNPNFIAAISFNQNNFLEPGSNFDEESISNSTTAMPTGLAIGETAIHIYDVMDFSEQDNSHYDCALTEGTKEELLVALCDKENWNKSNDNPFQIDPFPCRFTISVPTNIKVNEGSLWDVNITIELNRIAIGFGNDKQCDIKLYNSSGVLVDSYNKPYGQLQKDLSTSRLTKGLYLLHIIYRDGRITRKVML